MDWCHRLGQFHSHWLALRAMSLNAHVLADLLPGTVVQGLAERWDAWEAGHVPILDAHAFARADEGRPGCLPHRWTITADSVAARVAVVAGASRLALLKSVSIPAGIDWREAAERGWVDEFFGEVIETSGGSLIVEAVNLREV
jgi:aspartokinase-like uncharacterized kinase